MWILRVLDIGFYSILLWPLHIPLWCTGYLVRDKVKSPTGRWIFWSILVAGLFLCELICWWISSSGRWAMFIVIASLLDLVIGYFFKEIGHLPRILGNGLTRLINWINQEKETETVD